MASFLARCRLGAYGLTCALALVASAPAHAAKPRTRQVCGSLLPGFAHCLAEAVSRPKLTAHAAAGTIPYGPADIQSAYGLTSVAADYGADQTVAIVDAYDLPSAAADLSTYRSHYGLRSCTIANGCFRKVNQNGVAGSYPPADAGWGGEIALDIEAVSATCPHCRILLVEANSSSLLDLAAAVNRAATMGATQISNSYGGDEQSGETFLESYYNHPGVAVTVSSGDDGYGVEYPAASAYVTAVGGTSLHVDSSDPRGWSETAWNGSGSGCSSFIAKPAWQTDVDCAKRSVADVSAVADPYTGIAAYDSYHGWMQVGGTSLAAPVVAAAYALTGSASSAVDFAYDHSDWFNDVTEGSNGSCTFSYLCTALTGFDGPTGVGTPAAAHPTGAAPPDPIVDSGPNPPASIPQPVAAVTPKPAVAKSSVLVSRSAVRAARSGRLTVRITCGGGPACSGLLNLQTKLRGAALRTLGKARYSVASDESASVTVRLSRRNLSFLHRKHSLLVYGTALDSDGTTAQSRFRLRAPKPPKAH